MMMNRNKNGSKSDHSWSHIDNKSDRDLENWSNWSTINHKKSKVMNINTDNANVAYLAEIEKMRNNHYQLIQFQAKKWSISQNKNYLHPQLINDNYILSKLSNKKMYYKSVQSNMINPKNSKGVNSKLESWEIQSYAPYSDYSFPSKIEINQLDI